jgi:small nuclear ribonucleoprotein (snRNP)-like protein
MQNQRKGAPSRSGTTEMKASSKESDLNRQRLLFVLTSLIGQKVTAKLRDNMIYEGLLHSISGDADFAITLKSARKLATEVSKSGKVLDALIILGKDFLQVSALDVPSPGSWEKAQKATSQGFRTDGEISKSKVASDADRELVPWSGGAGGGLQDEGGLEEGSGSRKHWDQFESNEQMFGVSTTFNEDLYTTKLDPNTIPKEKREEAERLAREIESGVMASECDDGKGVDGDEDEEGRFSAVQGTGAYRQKGSGQGGGSNSDSVASASAKGRGSGRGNHAPLSQIPPMPEDRDAGAKGKGLAAHSPSMMKTSMISEMKRINALNLEPAVPKLEDKTGSDWINFQQTQARSRCRSFTNLQQR